MKTDSSYTKSIARFWRNVNIDKSGCWLWIGYCIKGPKLLPYGRLNHKLAHRLSWELYVGEIQKELCVLHKCDNPKCVNPWHLFLGTRLDNMKDRNAKLRQARGEKSGRAKLTEEQAKYAKYSSEHPRVVAHKIGVTKSIIYNIRAGRIWKHV